MLSYIYTGDGQLYSVHDSATGYTYIYTYDSLGRLIASRVEDSSSQELMRTKLWYNASNQITKQTWTIGDTTYQETYAYNTGDATLSSYQNALGQTVSLGYDFLRRLSTVTAGNIYTQTYTYRDIDESKTTTQVSGLAYSGFTGAPSYGYTYDILGNILTYTENGTAYAYTYDDLNQLLTATGGGKAWAYTYDLGGNILTATDGTTSHTYTYGDADWADLLTAFDGQAITYDASGNPLSYYNGNRYTFAWAEGRRLTSAAVNGKTYTYAYDSDGLRLSKTVDGATHNYFYASGNLLRETYGNVTLDFLYDNHGYPYALVYTTGETAATYYYITNLQGDVLSLIDTNGATVVSYQYDPYGKLLSVSGSLADSIGQINPLRYRGYYFDSETQLYYLQSRYYDPTTCRFINADAYASTGQGILGHNMFAYCLNNPVNRIDLAGTSGASVATADDDGLLDELGYAPSGGSSAGSTIGCVLVAGVGTVGAMGLNEFLKLLVGPVDLDFIPIGSISAMSILAEAAKAETEKKAKAKAEAISATLPTPTVIYRYGGTNPGSLTPKEKDKYSGLSFSTIPMPGAAMTTIEALNATGVVYAVQDSPIHVSVRPVGATMDDWIKAGRDSIWTQAVKSVVIKWKGGY